MPRNKKILILISDVLRFHTQGTDLPIAVVVLSIHLMIRLEERTLNHIKPHMFLPRLLKLKFKLYNNYIHLTFAGGDAWKSFKQNMFEIPKSKDVTIKMTIWPWVKSDKQFPTIDLVEYQHSLRVSSKARNLFLAGGWTNPFEKHARQIGWFPQVGGVN